MLANPVFELGAHSYCNPLRAEDAGKQNLLVRSPKPVVSNHQRLPVATVNIFPY